MEDEPLPRARLRELLEAEPDIEVVDSCENGKQAIRAVQATSPDVVFLDVQMPEMDGFAFLEAIPGLGPVVIIVTGHEKHAIKAFDVHAVDFLLKPFDKERFRTTLRRARERIQNAQRLGVTDVAKALRQMIDTPRGLTDRIAIKSNGRILFVAPAEIDWIDAVGNYCEIHVGRASHMLLSTLTALESRLPADAFMRISRSTIVNVFRVKELRFGGGSSTLLLQDGTELSVSASYRQKVNQLAG